MGHKLNTSKFLNHLRKDDILVPHLNVYFANGEFPDEIPLAIHPNKEEDNAFHPSSATRCAREIFAAHQGDLVARPHTAEQQLNFMIGHMYHSLIQWVLVEGMGFTTWDDIEKEYDFGWDKEKNDFDMTFVTDAGNPYRLRGFSDVARCDIPNRGTYLVDLKTMNSRLFAQDSLPATTYEKYEAQVKHYLEFEDLDKAIILCVSKDSPHRFKEIVIERDSDFVERSIDRVEDVVDAIAAGVIPDCTCADQDSCPTRNLYDTSYA